MIPVIKVPHWVSPFKSGVPVEDSILLNRLYDYPVKYWPDKPVISDGLTTYSFVELYNLSVALATRFVLSGIKKGDRIMVIAEKYSEMAIVVPAIWKCGAVYVPVDPSNPVARNEYLFNSINPRLVIVPAGNSGKYNLAFAKCPIIYFEQIRSSLHGEEPEKVVFPNIDEQDLAYIMHTSGSTGEPKGVMIEHGSVIDYFYNHNLVLKFTESSYCLSNAPFYFDVSIEDTFLPLSVGASVYQYRGLTVSALVLSLISREGITHLIAVSTVLALITGDGEKLAKTDLTKLEMVMTGAEVCDIKVINTWKKAAPHVRVLNVYGPTETTIVCTAYTIEQADHDRTAFYPIGKPLNNVSVLLFDENAAVIEQRHLKGTLFVGGSQVMRGYWNDDALTSQVIINYKGTRYYNTGDICYWDDNGDLVFCGRNDDEIKLLGRRINLLEIKRKFLQFPYIKSAAIGVITVDGRKLLAAVVALNTDAGRLKIMDMRECLKEQLPIYMIPEFIGIVETPLLSRTGKNDDKTIMSLFEKAIGPESGNIYVFDETGRFVPLTY